MLRKLGGGVGQLMIGRNSKNVGVFIRESGETKSFLD